MIDWKTVKSFAKFGAVIGVFWAVLFVIFGALIGNVVTDFVPEGLSVASLAIEGAVVGAGVGLALGLMIIVSNIIGWGLAGIVFPYLNMKGYWGLVIAGFVASLVTVFLSGVIVGEVGFSVIGVVFSFINIAIQAKVGLFIYSKLKWRAPV